IILQRIILEAKRMLLFTDESSKAIAYHLRFEDPSYFSRCFKRKTGYSPLNFRQLVREKYHRRQELYRKFNGWPFKFGEFIINEKYLRMQLNETITLKDLEGD